jgi:hypothetical protein
MRRRQPDLAARCARLLADDRPFPVVVLAQRALGAGDGARDEAGEAGRLHLLLAEALARLGLRGAAGVAACDGGWLLAIRAGGQVLGGAAAPGVGPASVARAGPAASAARRVRSPPD